MNLKMMMMGALVGVVAIVSAEVKVVDIKARQRYPWNGKVDVEYTIAADDQEADIFVTPYAYDADRGWTLFPKAFSGEGVGETVKPGKHRMVFDAKADLGPYSSSAFQINIIAGKHLAPYIVIDLSGGTNTTSYPIRTSLVGPDLSNDACRTTNLWLRLIPPGTFFMGSPDGEIGRDSSNEDYHKVTLTKPFYMGVFEVTQRQYELVMGKRSSRFSNTQCYATRPVEFVAYTTIRGNSGDYSSTSATVANDSFMGVLRKRTQTAVFPEIGGAAFDLPTEAQWEYACRLGTVTALNTGNNLLNSSECANLNRVARYAKNAYPAGGPSISYTGDDTQGTAKVGSYLPNVWGLYDMHGNVLEWCRDCYVASLGMGAIVDPCRSSSSSGGSYRVLRGGSWGNYAQSCRSASRSYYPPSDASPSFGFRLCCTAGLH